MANTVIADLVDGECIISASLIDLEGYTIERTSIDFSPTSILPLLDLNPDSSLITIVGEESTIIASRIETGHTVIIQCPKNSNLGKARMNLSKACNTILPFL